MNRDLPEQEYTDQDFLTDLHRIVKEDKASGRAHFKDINPEELTAPQDKAVFKKFVRRALAPADVESYGLWLMDGTANTSQKELLSFLTAQTNQHAVVDNSIEQAETELKEFRKIVDRMVEQSRADGETFFSQDFSSQSLYLTDLLIYRKFENNEITVDKLVKRASDPKEPANKSQKEFSYYLAQKILQKFS